MKTIFILRCFYGEALHSGNDLKAKLRRFAHSAAKIAIIAAALAALAHGMPARAQNPSAPATNASTPLSAPTLSQAITDTIRQEKYVWRMPRDQGIKQEQKKGVIASFVQDVRRLISQTVDDIIKWLKKVWHKLFPSHPRSKSDSSSGYGWIVSLNALLYVLVAAAIIALALLIYRIVQRKRVAEPRQSEAIQPAPDLNDENVHAGQMPEDGWTRLARELLERGEYRLAMRAFYLAALAHLAERNLISIARFKSNRDYERELRRRAHALPDLLPVFGDTVAVFEGVWYGMHQTSREMVDGFAANVDKLKGNA